MKNVTNTTNAIDTMLHLHSASSTASLDTPLSSLENIHQHMPVTPANDEEQALNIVEHCLRSFGSDALQELESHMERLQEEFLAHLHTRLQERNIHLDEKLVLSLSNENTLVLQCQEHEEALLVALGEDEALRERLQELRSRALLAHGLQYVVSARDARPTADFAQYKVCVKGMLSHFYLR